MEGNRRIYVTHIEDYVQTKDGIDVCVLFEGTRGDDSYKLLTHLVYKNKIENMYKKYEKELDSEKECFKLIGSVISKFNNFTKKVLIFDDIYSDEFMETTYNNWFDPVQ